MTVLVKILSLLLLGVAGMVAVILFLLILASGLLGLVLL